MVTDITSEMSKNIAQKALDEFYYKDKSLREWMKIIVSEDCVSRAEVIKLIDKHTNDDGTLDDDITCILEELPHIQPKSNVGYWETYEVIQGGLKETWHRCSICKWENALLLPRNYCPKCGTKMEA